MKISLVVMTARLMMTASVALFVSVDARADGRSASLVNSFQVFCALQMPNFFELDAKANAMKLVVRKELGTHQAQGQFAHSKSWLVTLETGTHELVATEARGPKENIVGCGIGAADVRGSDMREELTRTMHLGKPVREAASADGKQRLTTWKINVGPDQVTLLLADRAPTDEPGIYLTLLHETPAEPSN
jgi:hypothetical protein